MKYLVHISFSLRYYKVPGCVANYVSRALVDIYLQHFDSSLSLTDITEVTENSIYPSTIGLKYSTSQIFFLFPATTSIWYRWAAMTAKLLSVLQKVFK